MTHLRLAPSCVLLFSDKTTIMGFDIKRMDIYRKVPKDLTQPTVTGAVISICCVLFIIFMLATELLYFVSPDVKSELLVANNDPTEK